MANHEATSPPNGKPLWRFIPHHQFTRPQSSAREKVRKGLLGVWGQLWNRSQEEQSQSSQSDLRHLSDALQDRIAPKPDWSVLCQALDVSLLSWLNNDITAERQQIVIGALYGGTSEALKHWANTHDLLLLTPPKVEELLAGNHAWLDHLPHEANTTLVLPALEQCYLRHTHGLLLIRQLLQRLVEWPGRCVLGCSSWSWTYLSKAVGIDTLFLEPWTLEALDGERLQVWFSQLSKASEMPVVFRQADNGRFVIPPAKPADPATASAKTNNEHELSTFLTDVAAYSRGNPGVAWAIWRYSLSRLPDEDIAEHDSHLTETVWVKPWQQIRLPAPPKPCNHSELFVLQAVLLHHGLTTQALTVSLPLSTFEIQRALTRLRNLGVLELSQHHWQVSPLAYPAVRELLASEGFLVDEKN